MGDTRKKIPKIVPVIPKYILYYISLAGMSCLGASAAASFGSQIAVAFELHSSVHIRQMSLLDVELCLL